MSNWTVYLLRCADSTLYTGVTTDLARRLRQHNGELSGGASYTRGRRPVTVVYREHHPDRSSAQQREAALKRLGKREREALVES